MKKIVLMLFIFSTFVYANMHYYNINPKNKSSNNIKILDSVQLDFDDDIHELSDLAYKKGSLYALSDKGILYDFRIKIKKSGIEKLTLRNSVELENSDEEYKKMDTEGLAFMGKKLLVSYERRPKVELRTVTGKKISDKEIHKDLEDITKYVKKNNALESVAYNAKYGIITAPEIPLKESDAKYHTLYAKEKTWKFKADGAISALEFMSKNEVMILQRTFSLIKFQKSVVISKLNLKNGEYEVLAKLDSKDGWKLDNFEGLTKVSKNRYLIVSDDNDSYFQKTLLVLFEVI